MISLISAREIGQKVSQDWKSSLRKLGNELALVPLSSFLPNDESLFSVVVLGFSRDGERVFLMQGVYLRVHLLFVECTSLRLGEQIYSINLSPSPMVCRPITFDLIEVCFPTAQSDILCTCRFAITKNVLSGLESRCYIFIIAASKLLYSTDIISLPGHFFSFACYVSPSSTSSTIWEQCFVVSCRRFATFFLVANSSSNDVNLGHKTDFKTSYARNVDVDWSNTAAKPLFISPRCKHCENCWFECSWPCNDEDCILVRNQIIPTDGKCLLLSN